MSIESGTFFYAVCDACGERVTTWDELGYIVDESAHALGETISDCDGLVAEDGTVTCPACVSATASEAAA